MKEIHLEQVSKRLEKIGIRHSIDILKREKNRLLVSLNGYDKIEDKLRNDHDSIEVKQAVDRAMSRCKDDIQSKIIGVNKSIRLLQKTKRGLIE